MNRYKQEYAELIAQAQSIKGDLSTVESKVERSVNLLKSLSSEQTRWEASSESFKVQMSTIIGDVVLSSALMAYAGYYDQVNRILKKLKNPKPNPKKQNFLGFLNKSLLKVKNWSFYIPFDSSWRAD